MLLFRSRAVRKKYQKIRKKALSFRRSRFITRINRNFRPCKDSEFLRNIVGHTFRPSSMFFYSLKAPNCFVKSTFVFKNSFVNLKKFLPNLLSHWTRNQVLVCLENCVKPRSYCFFILMPSQYKLSFLKFVFDNFYLDEVMYHIEFFSLNCVSVMCYLWFDYFSDYVDFMIFAHTKIFVEGFELPLIFMNFSDDQINLYFEVYRHAISFLNRSTLFENLRAHAFSDQEIDMDQADFYKEMKESFDLVENEPHFFHYYNTRNRIYLEGYGKNTTAENVDFEFLEPFFVSETMYSCQEHVYNLLYFFLLLCPENT